jgi:flagellar hook-basal body complex protein FliE
MDYGSAISKVLPGTFVPDLGAATKLDESPKLGGIPGGIGALEGASGASFAETLKAELGSVNDKLVGSDQLQRDLAAGKTNDLQKVVTSAEEANLALSFTTAMRSKLLEAYQEIARMQI